MKAKKECKLSMAEKRCGLSRQAHVPKVVGSNPTSAKAFFLLSLQWQQKVCGVTRNSKSSRAKKIEYNQGSRE